MQALGFIEISGVTAAITALDVMVKTAAISLVTWERKMGGRLVTMIVTGEVSAVTAAVEAACAQGIQKPCASLVLARPHEETRRLVALSAARIRHIEGSEEE